MVDRNFPAARKGLEGPRGGFGFQGPSEAWLRANGLSSSFTGHAGSIEPESQLSQEEINERRRKALDRFDNMREEIKEIKENKEINEPETVPNKRSLTETEIEEKLRIAKIREENLKRNQEELDNFRIQEESPPVVIRDQEKIKKCLNRPNFVKKEERKELQRFSLQQIFNKNSDFFIQTADGQQVSAHRNVLAARSSFFADMFAGNTMEARRGVFCLNGFSLEAVQSILGFFYTGELVTSNTGIVEVAYLADFLKVENLKYLLQIKLAEFISVDNLVDLWELAVELKFRILKIRCEEFVAAEREVKKIHLELPNELKNILLQTVKKN
jgi:hypothetical protein